MSGHTQTNNATDQLRSFIKNTKTASGTFEQTLMRSNGSSNNKKTSGRFSFSRPGKFIWSIAEPFELLMVSDGQKVWQYDKDLNQVTVRAMGQALSATPASLLFGNDEVEHNFVFSINPEVTTDQLQWLTAKPKNTTAGTALEFSQVMFGMKDGIPQVLELKDGLGQTTHLKLRFTERNAAIKPEQFTFTVPKGADLVQTQ